MWLVCIDLSLWSFPWDFLAYMHAATCSYTEPLLGDLTPLSMYMLQTVNSVQSLMPCIMPSDSLNVLQSSSTMTSRLPRFLELVASSLSSCSRFT